MLCNLTLMLFSSATRDFYNSNQLQKTKLRDFPDFFQAPLASVTNGLFSLAIPKVF